MDTTAQAVILALIVPVAFSFIIISFQTLLQYLEYKKDRRPTDTFDSFRKREYTRY